MSKPQVTITLGRTGQKVVKRPPRASGTNFRPLLGNKRLMRESDADTSMLSINKRLRGDVITRSSGYNRVEDAGVGRNDLRLKLTRKRISRRIQHEVEERKKMELRQNVSRTIWAPEGPERRLLRQNPPTQRTGEIPTMDSIRRSYSSRTMDGLITKSPERVLQAFRRISPPRDIDEMHRVLSTRSVDASRAGRSLGNDVLDPSRPKGPAASTMRTSLNAEKPVRELPPASGVVPQGSYLGEQPLTVSSLLHSLGLGKYVVQFQAEEVDMTALKQMGDHDLKEMGIPMGPRKKILLAILPRPKKKQL